jgi:putative YhbY family RNA-binding protein
MPVTLTARERAHLKARAHALEPVVHIGHGGVTDNVIAEVERSLVAHELIKVRAGGPDRDERHAAFAAICARTGAASVQTVGKVMVLWRPNPEESSPAPLSSIEQD